MGMRMTIEEIDNGNRRYVTFKKFYGYVPYESVRKSFNYLVDHKFFEQSNSMVNGDASMGYEEYKHLYDFLVSGSYFECEMNMSNDELFEFLRLYKLDWVRYIMTLDDLSNIESCTDEAWSCLINFEDNVLLKDMLNTNHMKEVDWS